MKVATLLIALSTVAVATQNMANDNRDSQAVKAAAASPPNHDGIASTGNKCSDCAFFCTDSSNGSLLQAACLVIKCGIQCLIA